MTAILLGIAVGIVLGLTGAGGGILAVPALVFGLGWPMPQAAPVALIAVAGAAAIGSIDGLRRRLVRYRAAAFMAVIGVVTAPAGLMLARVAPENMLLLLFASAMFVVALRTLRDKPPADDQRTLTAPCRIDPATGRLHWTPGAAAVLASIGAASGFLTGLLGVGGGFLIVPALRRFSDITIQGIVATSLSVIALVSASSVFVAWLHTHELPVAVAVPFAGGAALGMVAGRAGAGLLKPLYLQRTFAVVALIVATGLVVRALVAMR
jgi:uncharacterized protein